MKTKQIQLNPEQQAAVNTREGYWAIHAGPGAGKTTVLVARYCALVEEGSDYFAKEMWGPEDVLALTFTSDAAKEMRKRAKFVKSTNTRPHGFLTFHSLALSFATIEREEFPFKLASFPLATEGQSNKFIGDVTRAYALDFKNLKSWMSRQKHANISPAQALDSAQNANEGALAKAYRDYETKCKNAGVLDFDSLMTEMVNILESNSEVRARWQFIWVLVDEANDCDQTQWHLVKLISEKHKNVFAVGDGNQSIYNWRGANSSLFTNFESLFPGAQKLFLAKNHRSVKEIVSFCKEIAPDKELGSRFYTENAQGVPPAVVHFPNSSFETESVVVDARKALDADKTVAVLARTNRQLRAYEDACATKGIQYKLLGKSGYWQQPEIKNIVAYLRLTVNPHNDTALATALRSPYDPSRFIRKKELLDLLSARKGSGYADSYYTDLKNTRHPDDQQNRAIGGFINFIDGNRQYGTASSKTAVSAIINNLNIINYYEHEEDSPDNSPKENIDELIKISDRFSSVSELLDYVRRVSVASRLKKAVALSTIHSSKGLEFGSVFLIGAQEELLPHAKGELSEEERLFFVACSRAAERLQISYAGLPSRFIPKKYLENTAVS